jgi:glycosyltransferase involved in cell wall biosynthesis
MRLGLDLLYLIPGVVGGTETYATGLLPALRAIDKDDEFTVYVNREAAEWPLPDGFRRVVCPFMGSRRGARYCFQQVHLPALLRRDAIDLVHSLGYVGPLRTLCARVATVHDLNYRAFGHEMPVVRRRALEFFVGMTVRRADAIIADSEFTRSELVAAFGVSRAPFVMVPLAARPRPARTDEQRAAERAGLGLPSSYVLAFGGSTPNKNLPRLLDAFARARSRGLAQELVIVGRTPAHLAEEAHSGVRLAGYLGEVALDAVLSGADVLIVPSIYEGFGLVLLEAMEAGVPIVCSSRAALPEVAGDAAVYFDPYNVEGMASRILEVGGDPERRQALRHRGGERVRGYSWQRTAQETLKVYRDVLASRWAAR